MFTDSRYGAHKMNPKADFAPIESVKAVPGEQISYVSLTPGKTYTATYDTVRQPSGEVLSTSESAGSSHSRSSTTFPWTRG